MEYEYNRQGERTKVTDQNGTIHEYNYDLLGRLTQDRITTAGTGVDDDVRRVQRTYEVRGMLETVTSYDNATVGTGSVLNDVKFVYNDFGQLTTEYQDHEAVVNTSTTLKVGYSYADGSDNHIRPTKVTYPNDRELNFNYGTGGSVSDNLSRVASLIDNDGSTHLADYGYLGTGGISNVDLSEPALLFDLDHGATRAYTSLDSHGRVVEHWWIDHGANPNISVARIGHGYDRASNRLWREDMVAADNSVDADEFYTYDGTYRLARFQRGDVTTGATPSMSIGDTNFQEYWTLDPTGNVWEYVRDKDGDATLSHIGFGDEMQHRVHNKANETTAINKHYGLYGRAWATPAHDRAGNMTEMPQPGDLVDHYHMIYDAWNRLVEVRDADDTTLVAGYEYDGLNRRVAKEVYDSGSLDEVRHFYYSSQWQVLEERSEVMTGSAGGGVPEDADTQYVWGLRYIDDLILRDRDADGSSGNGLEERLYALQDANWNVVALAEPDGDIVERFIYDGYGHATPLAPDFTSYTGSDYTWPYLFTGRRLDEEIGMMQYRNRYYHIQLGRFVTRDPIGYGGGDANLYGYVFGNPLAFSDPSGLQEGKEIENALALLGVDDRTIKLMKTSQGRTQLALETLCHSKCLKCSESECLAEAKVISAAYEKMFYDKETTSFPRFGIRDDYRRGWMCYQWQSHTYYALSSIVKSGKCFDIQRVGYVSSKNGISELAHNWVAISTIMDKSSRFSLARSGKSTVYLDPWIGNGPEAYCYTGTGYEQGHPTHNFLGGDIFGEDPSRPTGITGWYQKDNEIGSGRGAKFIGWSW